MNQLILGDCLEVLKKMDAESIDLIYLDPPFFSNRNYEVIWGDAGESRSFQDRWSGGIDHYIAWLKERAAEMHRVLKSTGSIFLHCDYHANAYIRVYILDKIFGEQNLRNEIIWQRTNAHNDARKRMPHLCDSIFYYTKSDNFQYNTVFGKIKKDYEEKTYRYKDERGKYRLGDLTGPKTSKGESGREWHGFNPSDIGRSWAVPNKIVTELVGDQKCKKMKVLEKLDLLYENGYIIFSKTGTPSVKRYLDLSEGSVIGDFWSDIFNVQSNAKERIGYPTQKPEALLERIINCASNKGDIVLDPFVGGGTTVAVADRLERQWIGIDQSVSAIKVSEMRLNRQSTLFSKPFVVQLHKYDYDTLRYKDAFDFETWIIGQYGGFANTKQKSDFGTDGKTGDGRPVQVKRSDNIGRNVIDNFKSACERYDKKLFEKNRKKGESAGVIIAFSFGKGAVQEVARLKNEENIIIELVRVDEIIPIAKKPVLTALFHDLGTDKKNLREIEFIAKGESESGIEFYAWDWNYDEQKAVFRPEILRDKEGKQIHKFKAGTHCIGVKVVDNDGLESMEVIKLKINGNIEEKEKHTG
ncbi:MAG: site-specific DNA-methyltransferase [Desulfococcaceae bacterium]